VVDHQGRLDLTGRRVLVPGGTGGVGEGIVRRFLAAGADVAVATRSEARSREFLETLGDAATEKLHLVVHDYTTFAEADDLARQVEQDVGAIDHVVAPIGGWWAGRRLLDITETDWQDAFVALATTHMAVLRATLPRLRRDGSYAVIVGDSASTPIPGSGLVSMEQAAILMMQRVASAESAAHSRVFAFVLGPVRTRFSDQDASGVSTEQIGNVAVSVAAAHRLSGREIPLHDSTEVETALRLAASGS